MASMSSRPGPSAQQSPNSPSPTRRGKAVGDLSLHSYIPFGVLSAHTAEDEPYPNNDCWTEVKADAVNHANYAFVAEEQPSQLDCRDLFSLIHNRWIRVFHSRDRADHKLTCLRIFVLPEDVARRDVDRDMKRVRQSFGKLLSWPIDTSSLAWEGYDGGENLPRGSTARCGYQQSPPSSNESLFYIFNTISSPSPNVDVLPDVWSTEAAEYVLDGQEDELGVKTSLYPYQRRSIVTMMQRETAPKPHPDPRLEPHIGPTGQMFFYDRVTSHIFLDCADYEEPRGGILAETMGYGKTLIVLGLIAATKDQMPKTPIEHTETRPFTNKFGARSLMSMAADSAIKNGLPWRQYFRDMASRGIHYETCKKVLETPPYYEMISTPTPGSHARASRQERPIQKVILCKTTLVIVPSNLFDQWRAEIRKHLQAGVLDILEVSGDSPLIGTAEELAQYDLILMDKQRYYAEMGYTGRLLKEGQQMPSWPLRKMHFLRMVIDEGHTFASTGTANMPMSHMTSFQAERRWIVSGTPSHGLVGVEVDLAASTQDRSSLESPDSTSKQLQLDALERRKQQRADDIKDLARLGRIVTELLRVQPWSNALHSGDAASWSRYTKIGGSLNEGFYSAASVKSILRSIVVRHQISDVEAELPPLHNKAVYLEPTKYDKFSMDLFTFVMMNNTVTSEREDQDYLLHESNRKSLDALVMNLRRAPFFWSGFPIADIQKGLEIAQKYDHEHPKLAGPDKVALTKALNIIPTILDDKIWQIISVSQEIAVAVSGLPQSIGAPLGIDERSLGLANSYQDLTWVPEQVVTTASRLIRAQKFCQDNLHLHDPLRELASVVDKIANTSEHSDQILKGVQAKDNDKTKKDQQLKGIPQLGETRLSEKQFAKHKNLGALPSLKRRKRSLSEVNNEIAGPIILASDIRLSGTVSAKFSYLLRKVLELHKSEKILIFYEGDFIAWYIAQGLELIDVPHFIYANGIGAKMRNKYLETFMQDTSEERVMLIDLRQGSHGLNITAASRIFFVNPVWNVGTEAQAIKRAHRIGQKKPVYVETLILQDSIEHKIFERRRQMTTAEQARATGNPLDDNVVYGMFKNFDFYGVKESMADGHGYAPLTAKPLVFPVVASLQTGDLAAAAKEEHIDTEITDVEINVPDGVRSSDDKLIDSFPSALASRPVKKVKKVGFA